VKAVAKWTGCAAKSLKLAEKPGLRNLEREHELLQAKFAQYALCGGDLDLRVQQMEFEPVPA
jgi:hypothetical protein